AGQGRDRAVPGMLPAGPQQQRLVPAAGPVRADRHADRRRRWRLPPRLVQRQAGPGAQGQSEAELHLLRSRLNEGLRARAARGELRLTLPAGLDYDDDDHVIITPDEAVREAITCVFRRFDQLGSARQVVVSLRADELRLPRRDIRTGKIIWAQANYPAVHGILIHPGYAGVFAYGRSKLEKHPGTGGNVI